MDSVDSATMVGKCYLFGVSRALGKNWKQGCKYWKQFFRHIVLLKYILINFKELFKHSQKNSVL